MSQWYYNKNGQAHGPVDQSKIGELIKAGELTQIDLVFEMGANEWTSLSQVSEFTGFFAAQQAEPEPAPTAPPPPVSEPQEWVILRKAKAADGSEYKQMGPYTKTQVLQSLDNGSILFSDYGWKTGMESWVPLNKIPDFKTPLPSSPPVNKQVYQSKDKLMEMTKTEAKGDLTSLTELVEIEKYQREKTQVITPEQLRKQWQEEAKTNTNKPPQGNPQELWSLTPPQEETRAPAAPPAAAAPPVALEISEDTPAPKPKKKAVKKKVKGPSSQPAAEEIHGDSMSPPLPWTWVGALAALAIAFVLVVVSMFSGGEGDEVAEDLSQPEMVAQPEPMDPPPPQQSSNRELQKLKAKYAALKAQREAAEREALEKQIRDEQARQKQIKREQMLAKKKALAASKAKKKKQAKVKKSRKKLPVAASKKKAPKKKIASARPKPKPKPKPKAKPVAKAKPKAKQVASGSVKRGSYKARSFFIQRDRKALFYAAFEAEKLVVELETSYKKLKGNKGQWNTFYRGWRSKVDKITPSVIRFYPQAKAQYGYPKKLAAYKKDYKLLKDYGKLYDARISGKRLPASPGKDLRQTFSDYQAMAQSLGAP